MCTHFNPLSFRFASRWTPLPPLGASYLLDTCLAEFVDNRLRGFRRVFWSNRDVLGPYPGRRRNPLLSECLQIFDGMVGSIVQEAPNQMKAFVVGDMGSRFVPSRLSIRVLDSQLPGVLT